MKTTITVSVKGQKLFVTNQPVIAAGGVNEVAMQFAFDDTWDGYDKTATFYRDMSKSYPCALVNDTCTIPAEVLAAKGVVFFGLVGVKNNTRRTTITASFNVSHGAYSTDNPYVIDASGNIKVN